MDTLQSIRVHETTIPGIGLPTNEERIAYWMSSIARFSLAYWINEFSLISKDEIGSLWIASKVRTTGWGEDTKNPPILKAGNPPAWVYADIDGAFVGALFTANPFVALGGGALSSGFSALRDIL